MFTDGISNMCWATPTWDNCQKGSIIHKFIHNWPTVKMLVEVYNCKLSTKLSRGNINRKLYVILNMMQPARWWSRHNDSAASTLASYQTVCPGMGTHRKSVTGTRSTKCIRDPTAEKHHLSLISPREEHSRKWYKQTPHMHMYKLIFDKSVYIHINSMTT